jgi:hypothetical protein
MGIDLQICEMCKEPLCEYDGGCMEACYCQNWICFNCIEHDDKFRNVDNEIDDNEQCLYCTKCEEKKEEKKKQKQIKNDLLITQLKELLKSRYLKNEDKNKIIQMFENIL